MKKQTQGKIDTVFYGIMIGIILMGIIWISLEYTSNELVSYKRGFQEGQANVTQQDIIKLRTLGNNSDVVWTAINTNIPYRGLICAEGYIINMTSPTQIGCVRK